MLSELTAEQWADVAQFREETFTEAIQSINGPELEKALTEAYEVIGEEPPRFKRVASPRAAQLYIQELRGSTNTGTIEWPAIYGDGWWRSWSAYRVWCGRLPEVKYTQEAQQKLDIIDRICRYGGWIWAYKGLVVYSERPVSKWTDPDDRGTRVIHCQDGPAVLFPDGWGVYAWNGTVVPKEWIMSPQTVDLQLCLTHENIEQRRALCEIIGWERVLSLLDCTVIEEHPNPEMGVLLEVELPEVGVSRFLKVHCATGRYFAIPVPPDTETVQAAQDNMWRLPPGTYNPDLCT